MLSHVNFDYQRRPEFLIYNRDFGLLVHVLIKRPHLLINYYLFMAQEITVFTILYQDSTIICCFNQLYCLHFQLYLGTTCVFHTSLYCSTIA